tara:strand:- start:301 stop:558 length:258 start_codon:yes stop_codon:yes gene_type:complete
MLVIAAYIATLCFIKIILNFLPIEEDKKKLIMRSSGCIATVVALLFYYKKQGIDPPFSPKLSQMSRSDSFSQASAFSGGSLLSDF